jgi:hypothetical protein
MPADDTDLCIKDVSETMDVIDHVCANITEYGVMLGIIPSVKLSKAQADYVSLWPSVSLSRDRCMCEN